MKETYTKGFSPMSFVCVCCPLQTAEGEDVDMEGEGELGEDEDGEEQMDDRNFANY